MIRGSGPKQDVDMQRKRFVCLLILGVLSIGHASAAEADARETVPLPDMIRQHMLGNMREHLAALHNIQSALARGELDRAGDVAEQRIGMSSLIAHHAAQMAPYMPQGMQAIGTAMHHADSRFAMTAHEGELARALDGLSKVTEQCVARHSAYRVHEPLIRLRVGEAARMEGLYVIFTASGVQTWLWLPPVVACVVSIFTSMVGISGAFLLLPFQMSVLHFTSPAVSATNLVFNLIAAPSGVYRYLKEGRMAWPLAGIIVVGTLPGIAIGYFVRVWLLPDPRAFKLFVGAVLLYVGYRLLSAFTPWGKGGASARSEAPRPQSQAYPRRPSVCPATVGSSDAVIRILHASMAKVEFAFRGEVFSFSVPGLFVLALVVGIVGGVYGIGGGALIAPFCVAMFHLPVHTVAGATLAGTLATSVFGVAFYSLAPAPAGMATAPDWALGMLFGLGGVAGMYLGARFQRYIPEKALRLFLGGLLVYLAFQYIAPSVLK